MNSSEAGVAGTGRRARHVAMAICIAAASFSVDAQDVVIGQVLSLTGPNSATAQELSRGRRNCADLINSEGGIRGKSLRLVTRDDRGDPAIAVNAARELLDRERAVALLGAMGPAVNAAVLDWAATSGTAVVGPQGGEVESRVRDSGVAFFLTANQSAEAERLAAHVTTLGISRVVLVYGSDQAGAAALMAFEEGLTLSNLAAAAVVEVRADGADAAKAAAVVTAAKPQAVFLATTGRATVAMLRALQAASAVGSHLLQVYGLSSAASPSELLSLGKQARGFSMSQVLPLPRDSRVPVVAKFLAAMGGPVADRTHAELEGCIGTLLLAEALRRKPGELTRGVVLQALKAAGRINLGGFEVELSDRVRLGSRFTDIVFVGADGRLIR